MRGLILGAVVVASASGGSVGSRRANFLHIVVSSARPNSVRAIWRPFAGGRTGEEQQAAIYQSRPYRSNADSVRRWSDPTARDTMTQKTPAEFVVDMIGGPIIIEAVGTDSILVTAQQTVDRGPLIKSWGHAFTVDADGIRPYVERRR